MPELPEFAANVRYRIKYQSELRSYPSYNNFYYGSGYREGDRLNHTIYYLTRDTEYTIEIQAYMQYSHCNYNYAYGNYSEPVSFRTNATSELKATHQAIMTHCFILIVNEIACFQLNAQQFQSDSFPPYTREDYLGRVEVFYNNQWGTICNDDFTTVDANVVCQMLNFTEGAACATTGFGSGTGIIIRTIQLLYTVCTYIEFHTCINLLIKSL